MHESVMVGCWSVVAWHGNRGDSKLWRMRERMARSEHASSSIISRGRFGYPDIVGAPSAKAGDLTNEVLPDFEADTDYLWTALEDDSLELCAAICDENGEPTGERMPWRRAQQKEILTSDALLVIATGRVIIGRKMMVAPALLHVENLTAVEVDGAAMLIGKSS